MDEISIRSHWVSAWSTSPIDASLSETGVLDQLGVAVSGLMPRARPCSSRPAARTCA